MRKKEQHVDENYVQLFVEENNLLGENQAIQVKTRIYMYVNTKNILKKLIIRNLLNFYY